MNSKNDKAKISRVYRSKKQAKESYDKMSRFYDYFAGIFEKKYRNMALEHLGIAEGETVLEVGFGTGHGLQHIAASIGETRKVYGIDISSGMLEVSKKRLEKAGLLDRVELHVGDAVEMPFEDETFDAVFSSFTLELFDTPELPRVLQEIKRVLKPRGRCGIVSLSKEGGDSLFIRLYEWFHQRFPQYADCRPIYVEQLLREVRFEITQTEHVNMFGLWGEIVVVEKA
jgi:demethylmenaquinone methyltransferase/2-methoxy-6-polyprenyl-1,4-benzoquinol methylase